MANPFAQFVEPTEEANPFSQFVNQNQGEVENPFAQFVRSVEEPPAPIAEQTQSAPAPAAQIEAPVTAQPVTAVTAPIAEQPVASTPAPIAEQTAPTTPQEYPPYEPVQSELTAYTPSFIDRLGRMLGLGGNRDAASVELAARRLAKEQNISVGEVYRQAGGSRPMFNPEGRAILPAIGEAAAVVSESLPDIPTAAANTVLRAIRGGDIPGGEGSFLDYAIKQTETPDRKVDKNYQDLGGIGKSLGYSFATLGASILSSVGATAVAGPVAGAVAGLGTSGTVSYRASKDEFLSRVKDELDAKTKQIYGRELTKDEWQAVRGDFESAATKYGAWEAIPEAIGNLLMVRAFSAPAKGVSKSALNKLVARTAAIAAENVGETVTGVGQNRAELEAGLSKEELTIKDAFKQQFLSTMILGGTVAAGSKGIQTSKDFYQKYVEPKIDPQSALGRAIQADLDAVAINPQAIDAEAIASLQGVAPLTMEELAAQQDAQFKGRTEPKLPPNAVPPEEPLERDEPVYTVGSETRESITAPGKQEPTLTVDPETGEVITAPGKQEPTLTVGSETRESITAQEQPATAQEQVIQQRAIELRQLNGYPVEVALAVAQKEFAEGDLNVEPSRSEQQVDETVGGRVEPSINVPSEGTAATEGVAPLDSVGLDRTAGVAQRADVGAGEQRAALGEIPTLTTTPTPVEQAQLQLANAEVAVAQAATPEAKKVATKERNKARQTLKKAQAAPAVVEGAASVEAVAPNKRGRKPVVLTPEEQAVRKADRSTLQQALTKTARGVDKIIKNLGVAFDPNRFDSTEGIKFGAQSFEQARKDALYTLAKIANDPMFRGAAESGIKAKNFLASEAVTPQERANLAARLKFEKTGSLQANVAPNKLQAKPSRAFYKFKNASEALAHIANTGSAFERALAKRLAPFLKDVRLIIADTEENTPKEYKALLGTSSGVYHTAEFPDDQFRMIVLRGENFGNPDMQGVNNTVFLHEAYHAATVAKLHQYFALKRAGKPVPQSLQVLVNELTTIADIAQKKYDALKASGQPVSEELQHKFEDLEIGIDLFEFISYGITDPTVQKFLLDTPGFARKDQALGMLKNLFNRFTDSIRRAFNLDDKHSSAFQDLILVTEGLMQEEERAPAPLISATLSAKQAKVDKNAEKIRLSNTVEGLVEPIEQNVVEGHTFRDFNDLMQARFDAMGSGFIRKILATMQTADIIRWKGDAIPALKSIDTLVEKMVGSRMNMERAFALKADKFSKFIRKVGKQKVFLSNAMHLARLNSVSPTTFKDRADAIATDKRMVQLDKLLANPATVQEEIPTITRKRTVREKEINQTFDAWEKLSEVKGGQDMYRMVRQFYKDANILMRTLLDERIERLNVEGSIDDPSTPKGKLMLAVRRIQEGSDFKGIDEYFPFMRYGNFWLRINGPQGREFYLFENGTKRNAWLTKRARELGVDPKTETEMFDSGDDITALRTKYSPESKMLSEMFETVDSEMDKPGLDKDALKDALYQTYLMTLPEESYRKQFLHAENVTGFSSDVFRNFTTSANRIASQAAKLAYGDKISAELDRAKNTLERMPSLQKAKLGLFVNEIKTRVEGELNPPEENKLATRLNQFAYYSLLTGVASALTQTTAIPMLVMPVLNQQYGYGSSALKLAKYMSVWKSVGVTQEGADGEIIYTAPSIGSSSIVKSNPLLQRAFQEAVERGLTTQTNSSVLANTRRTPSNSFEGLSGVAARTAATVMSSLFTGAERMSREMAYLMTFELEYAKTKDFDASVEKAVANVQELLGRYDNFGRPRILQNFAGRTIGQFKMYAVNITSFFVRNAYTMFSKSISDPKEALAAMHRLTGTLAMAAVFGGVTSFPLYSFVTSAIDLILNNLGDDDEEKKKRVDENPYTAYNSDLRFRYVFLKNMFGDIKITGLDGKTRTLAAVLEKGVISELGDFNIGSRTSYNDLWWRDAKPGNTTQETIINTLTANLGPAVSSGLGMTGAIDDFGDGKIARGLERIAPALIKNPLTAARFAKEGAENPRGDIVMGKEEFSSFNLAMQSLGFQPTALTRYQENKYKTEQETRMAEKTKSEILGKLDNAILGSNSSDADIERVFNRVDKFNARYAALKHLRIDGDDVKKVLDKAKDREKYMFRGMYIRKENIPYILELRDATERPQ